MRVLLIGGSGFIGRFVTAELARAGHELAVFHRGKVAVPPHRSIVGDRAQLAASRDAIREFAPEVVIDLVLSSKRNADELIDTVRGVARRVVALSSMDVYRACGVLHAR
jgi:nucleoside-diphosphate-sugar epimerase